MLSLILGLQVISGIAWLIPLALYMPAVWRIWRAPSDGPARPDPVDVMVSPIAFLAALQVGFVMRWMLFPHAIAVMQRGELVVWAGLYTLSIVVAFVAILAWRVARSL